MEWSLKDPLFVAILSAIENKGNVLISGVGGCGKSSILRSLAAHLTDIGRIAACTATTGVAAVNLTVPKKIAGKTLHSWAGVGLGDGHPQKLVALVTHFEPSRKRWLTTDILFIDEVSMLSAEFFDKLDFVGRSIRRNADQPFGGLQIILSGDFLQLPPVKAKWVFESRVWKDMNFSYFIMDMPKRYSDIDYFRLLLRVRKGDHTSADTKYLKTRLDAYEDYKRNEKNQSNTLTIKPTMIYPKRIDVDFSNRQELEKLPGRLFQFIAADNFLAYNNHARYDDYIRPLEDTIPKAIELKAGAQVMLRANLDVGKGRVNGSRGVVAKIEDTTGAHVLFRDGLTEFIGLHTWEQSDKDGCGSRTQVPLILAYAITVHKIQGASLDYAICDCGPNNFLPSQIYVALSRVRSGEGLLLSEFYAPAIFVDPQALMFAEKIETLGIGVDEPKRSSTSIKAVSHKCNPVVYELVFEDFITPLPKKTGNKSKPSYMPAI